MRKGFYGLISGMVPAVVLVYFILVTGFPSRIDPLIVLAAVPFTLGG
jgi:multidrug efflux pump subunit AcrB